jgi:hypothetical protein
MKEQKEKMKCENGSEEDKQPTAIPKVKRAPFIVADAKEDIETGSRLPKEAASGSPNTKARKATNVDSFPRKFDRDDRRSADAIVAASASTSAIDARRRNISRDEHTPDAHTEALDSSVPPILTQQGRQLTQQGGQFLSPGARPVPVERLGLLTESDEIFELHHPLNEHV